MKTLRLTPIPSVRQHEDSDSLQFERDGFVDEHAVFALLNGPTQLRTNSHPEDLALAADDLDFAGWQVPSTSMTRQPEIPPQVIDAIVRRAAAPFPSELGLGAPHSGAHRWWLAGLAGALAVLIFSFLLMYVTWRQRPVRGPLTPAVADSRSQALPLRTVSHEFTKASSHQP